MTDHPTKASELKALSEAATQGEWTAANMVHADGRPMTPEELGEYVCNAVKLSDETRFLFLSGEGGEVDICHVGNGPKGPCNAALIAELVNAYRAGEIGPVEGWQPIETAPKETEVLAITKRGKIEPIFWGDFWRYNQPAYTHWMPLPPAPTTPDSGGEG